MLAYLTHGGRLDLNKSRSAIVRGHARGECLDHDLRHQRHISSQISAPESTGVEVDSVGDEAVVAPVGPQFALGAEQAGAAHDEPQLRGRAVAAAELVAAAAGGHGARSDLRLAAAGVSDACPVVVDGHYDCFDLGAGSRANRTA